MKFMKEKKDYKGVYVVNKEVGETPLQVINRFRKENVSKNPELDFLPITYAGRLDPMAEGLLILLVGEHTKDKEKYLNLNKTYEFEVLWGFETDTLDLLGLVVESGKYKVESKIPKLEMIQEYLNNSVGKFEQLYPAYSSRPVGGKPLFEWAREGKMGGIDIPRHEVEIFSAEHVSRREILKNDLSEYIIKKIDLVGGDFRQEETNEGWKEALLSADLENFIVDKFRLEVSSGFYVRQFVYDLARALGTKAVTFSIRRTRVGDLAIAKNI